MLAPIFCKKGDIKKFAEKDVRWYHILPDFFIGIFPIIGGIIILITDFSWVILSLLVILSVLFFGGTAAIRGSLVCRYCRQREIGCPAEELFNKKRSN